MNLQAFDRAVEKRMRKLANTTLTVKKVTVDGRSIWVQVSCTKADVENGRARRIATEMALKRNDAAAADGEPEVLSSSDGVYLLEFPFWCK